jgi:hypothetical protein
MRLGKSKRFDSHNQQSYIQSFEKQNIVARNPPVLNGQISVIIEGIIL